MGALPVIFAPVAVIRVYGPLPETGVPVTDTFEPVAKSIVPPVLQGLSRFTATVPPFEICRVVMDPLPRTVPYAET